MTVTDDDLRKWAEPPDSTLPWWTHGVLRDALTGARRLSHCWYDIFLQGSYANGTNISALSDVDLVVQLTMPLEEDIQELRGHDRQNFHHRYEDAEYGWENFREDVLATLRERFLVHEGNKCIDITDLDSLLRVPADILPAIEYRRYSAFPSPTVEVYQEGVLFRDSHGRQILNFPKQHLRNGQRKDRDTGGRFKQVVRAIKNARHHLETSGFEPETAPSYFVECLIYNAPSHVFRKPLTQAVRGFVDWFGDASRDRCLDGFVCQNGLTDLFGDGESDKWEVRHAVGLSNALMLLNE